jgi:hypothetical protein
LYYRQWSQRSQADIITRSVNGSQAREFDSQNGRAENRFIRGMLMHQYYIEQLYLSERSLSSEDVSIKARHVVDRFLESCQQAESDQAKRAG